MFKNFVIDFVFDLNAWSYVKYLETKKDMYVNIFYVTERIIEKF